MLRVIGRAIVILSLFGSFPMALRAQTAARAPRTAHGSATQVSSPLTGIYRIDVASSDKLYSVVAGASSNLPFGEQQRFFIDLAVRLTPPDLLAIECRGRHITLGSSRAPRVTLVADGMVRTERASDGHMVRARVVLEGERLSFTSSGRTEDNFSVSFTSIDEGRRLRVTRRISAEGLNEPVVIQTFYNKISGVARWDIYGESLASERAGIDAAPAAQPARVRAEPVAAGDEGGEANLLRESLRAWVEATNARDLEKQMAYYMPQLDAFYLARKATRAAVRIEKARVFAGADLIDIRAEEPEIIFREGGRIAIMRFRKKYRIENGPRSRRGEVVQELRWRRTDGGWKIFSERDVRVIS